MRHHGQKTLTKNGIKNEKMEEFVKKLL